MWAVLLGTDLITGAGEAGGGIAPTQDGTVLGGLQNKLHVAVPTATYLSTVDLWDAFLRSKGLTNGAVLDRMKIYADANGLTIARLMSGEGVVP